MPPRPDRRISLVLAGCSIAVLLVGGAVFPAHATSGELQYLSPRPGSKHILPETNIIIRPGGAVDPLVLADDGVLAVSGSVSGPHAGRVRLLDDGRTITFRPFVPFAPGEEVRCDLRAGLTTEAGAAIAPRRFTFAIAGAEAIALRASRPISGWEDLLGTPEENAASPDRLIAPLAVGSVTESEPLPPDFPRLTRRVSGPTSPGYLFLSSYTFAGGAQPSYIMIVDDRGAPIFYRKFPYLVLNFELQPDGRLTYFDSRYGGFMALDQSYAVVDSFQCGNGYGTDAHELLFLPNGHFLLMSYDPQIVDMSQIVPGGRTDAIVVGLVIQELDRDRDVVFQWRSWDHFQITDANFVNLTARRIDYVHGNALEWDTDGNILLSSRYLDEITKIRRSTGDIIWRWGGKNNQFTIVNDPIGFSYQHHIRRLPNGNVTLFDNGSHHVPPYARAVEYRLDEHRRIATLVWQYEPMPPLYAVAMGSMQRLPSGNTLIGWGFSQTAVTEVTPSGEKVTELTHFPSIRSYRALRYEWPPVRDAAVRFTPDVVNLRDRAPWLAASVEPEGAGAAAIDRASVRFMDEVAADVAAPGEGAGGTAEGSAARVRFPRSALGEYLSPGQHRFHVSGLLRTGEKFRGYADVRVIGAGPSPAMRAPLTMLSARGAVPVRFSLRDGVGANATVAVFDVHGRLVRRWRAAARDGGVFSWDGRDADGARVGSGIYFVRVRNAAEEGTVKIVVAR